MDGTFCVATLDDALRGGAPGFFTPTWRGS